MRKKSDLWDINFQLSEKVSGLWDNKSQLHFEFNKKKQIVAGKIKYEVSTCNYDLITCNCNM